MQARFAILGCGNVAQKHVHAIQNLLQGARIEAFCDLIKERAEALGEKVGGASFSDVHEMMRSVGDKIDIISVLTPSGLHAQNVRELAQYGKPLIIEKPIALRLEDADDIIRICDMRGVRIFVVHQNRYNLPILKAREALEQGRFGRLVLGTVRVRWRRDQDYYNSADWRGTWAYDGGVFVNQASHHIDMLTWFMGDVESVQAMGATRLVDIECEDTGVAILRFGNGAMGIIEATTATRPKDLEGSISILGEGGSVVIGGFFMNELVTWEFEDRQPIDDVICKQYARNPSEWGWNLGEYLRGVLVAIKQGKSGLVDGLEGRKSLELISAIYESIEEQRGVVLRFNARKCRLGVV